MRDHTINSIKRIPENERTPDQWWMLGEYQVFNGLLDESEAGVNEGIAALTAGATLPQPSVACLMDLGWILTSRGLDALALPYLHRAADMEPGSRDILAIKAIAEIGVGKREQAVETLRRAANCESATEQDRQHLEQIESGTDLRVLRRDLVLRKIGPNDPELVAYSAAEQHKVAVYFLKTLHDRNPADMKIAYHLGYARYCLGQLDLAKPLLDAVVADDPSHADALTILGLIARKTDKPAVEMDMYSRAIAADPKSVLARVNLASRVMDENPFLARRHLDDAIEAMETGNPHRAMALDLMGNSFAHIEKDYSREAEFHRQALRLEPKSVLFRDNLMLSLFSAGRPIDARRVWQETKQLAGNHPLIDDETVQFFCNETLDPHEYMEFAQDFHGPIGNPGLRLLLTRAWKRRSQIPQAERLSFLASFGTLASHIDADDLALAAWREATSLEPSGGSRINEVVALQRLGRYGEALTLVEVPRTDRPPFSHGAWERPHERRSLWLCGRGLSSGSRNGRAFRASVRERFRLHRSLERSAPGTAVHQGASGSLAGIACSDNAFGSRKPARREPGHGGRAVR